MIAFIPLIFAIVGALAYALSANGKVQSLALYMFAGSWLVLMASLAGKSIRLLQ